MAIDFGSVTRAIGLPEMGISELLGGNTNSLNLPPSPDQISSFNIRTSPYYGTQSTGGNTGSSGGTNTNYTDLYKQTAPSGTTKGSTGNAIDLARQLEIDRQRKEAEERARVLKQARSAYDPLFEDLSRQESQLPTIQNDYTNVLNSGYQNQLNAVNRGQEAGLQQADASQGVIKQNQATSLRDLASNLSSAVNAFGQRLGQAGAGDSSAANMANFAYSKLANRNTADVMAQVRGQLAEVETAKQNIVRDAQDKLGALETWKATQTNVIQQYVNSLRDSINSARASGKTAMAQGEVDMIREGFTRAMERLQQINDLAVTSKLEIEQNAAASLADAQSFSQQLQQAGSINPEAITQAPIDTGSISSGATSSNLIPGTITEEKDQSLADLLNQTTVPSYLG